MSKTCLIRQPAGLGDIFFCQKIAYHYKCKGYNVVWPIDPVYHYLPKYLLGGRCYDYPLTTDDFPYKEIYHTNEIIDNDDLIFLPLQYAPSQWLKDGIKIMKCKYKMAGMDEKYHDWTKYFNFLRESKRENKLYYDILGLKDDSEYCLISKNYASLPNILKTNIPYDGDLQVVNVDIIEGFTVFDWCKVFENATEIRMIDTCFQYIIDKIELKANVLKLYTRRNTFKEIDYIFKTKWEFCK